MAAHIHSPSPLKLPIGISVFADLVRGGFTFVDKSLLIEEVLQAGAQVTLITRPRRFGKTLNLSMLQHFFAARAYGASTRGLFDPLAIAARPLAMEHQGRYPVIFVSLKEARGESLEEFETGVRAVMMTLRREYAELEESAILSQRERDDFKKMFRDEASLSEMMGTFRLLTELLYKHYGHKVVVLVDEYDAPIHSAWINGFYDPVVRFMRGLLSAGLKDNPYLFKSVVTGILRVSKESLFSGLNNLKVVTVLDTEYSAHFGFTEAEATTLLEKSDCATYDQAEIWNWYNGYHFGDAVILNPWSVINCLDSKRGVRAYWINSGDATMLKRLMAAADPEFKEELERLLQDNSIDELIDPNLVLSDLSGASIGLWSLLLHSGYLTALRVEHLSDGRSRCLLTIPNKEIAGLYQRHIEEWFSDTLGLRGYAEFVRALASGHIAEFEQRLREYLLESMSLFDAAGRHPEKFYHGLVLGMMVGLRNTHIIRSNRESGYGRYDMALIPGNGDGPAVIVEFKQVADPADLDGAAQSALSQIGARLYATEIREHGISRIIGVGMAFSGKNVTMAYKEITSI